MISLTNEQVLAASSSGRLLNIVSAPGSGKTTVAAERFGFLRYGPARSDQRGVLGLSFTRSAASELSERVRARWGERALLHPHAVSTFDSLHVEMLEALISSGTIVWPTSVDTLTVVDDYRGSAGYRWLGVTSYRRVAVTVSDGRVVSRGVRVTVPGAGIGNVAQHDALLAAGVVSHYDVRQILGSFLARDPENELVREILTSRFRAVIVDEVFDADALDLYTVSVAAESGLSITLIGDPRQALYGWRGARPELVQDVVDSSSAPYEAHRKRECR